VGQPTVGSNPTPSALTDSTPPIGDDAAMAIALDEARRAGERGEVPVGAVVVIDGQVVSQAGNRREQDGDPTAHAELLALRAAAASRGSWRLDGATLVVTLEPCPMCAGALVGARVARAESSTALLAAFFAARRA
jgi:tRNA(adenine34) deaminase